MTPSLKLDVPERALKIHAIDKNVDLGAKGTVTALCIIPQHISLVMQVKCGSAEEGRGLPRNMRAVVEIPKKEAIALAQWILTNTQD